MKLPKREYFFKHTLEALNQLGGSGTNDEINEKVIQLLKLPEELLNILHKNSNQSEYEYQMAWVRTMLKNQGLIKNSKRGVWALSNNTSTIELPEYKIKFSKNQAKSVDEEISEDEKWKDKVIELITEHISPSGFERLIQRMLREKGFSHVEVTGKSGDGGIDGKGIAKINGILSFHIIFQCKRYKGKVSSKEIRDFRGAMAGRTDKGLFITTGSFTRDAILEASRDGAPAIDLMDGEKLAEKLKELRLGLDVELVEKVKVNDEWFKKFDI